MASIPYEPPLKKRGKPRHGHAPRSARKRISSRKSAAQLRALDAPSRTEVRAELHALRLTAAGGTRG